jgi:hypothetical protein
MTVNLLQQIAEEDRRADWADYERMNQRASTRYERDTRTVDDRYDPDGRGQPQEPDPRF